MKRIITLVTAAGAAALMLFSTSAHAENCPPAARGEASYRPAYQGGNEGRYDGGYEGRYEGRHEGRRDWRQAQWRELQRERQAFYASWNGNRWARTRFERYYARRAAEIRYRG
jgi:hypothetical protein